MRKVYLLSWLLFVFSSSFTQDYQFFDDDYTVFKTSNFVFPYNTLTVSAEESKKYYEFQTMVNHETDDYFDLNGPGFLGQHAIWDTVNNYYVLFNRFNDSIFIYTHKQLNDTWVAWHNESDSALAKVVDVQVQETENSIFDTIKTISFIYPENGTDYFQTVHDEIFVISSERGLVECFNIVIFPGLPSGGSVPVFYELYEDEQVPDSDFDPADVCNFSEAEIYDLVAGDELHIDDYTMIENGSSFEGRTTKTIKMVLNRNETDSTIIIEMRRKYKVWTEGIVTDQGIDTLEYTYSKDIMDIMPPYRFENEEETFATIYGLGVKYGKVAIINALGEFVKDNEGNWQQVIYKNQWNYALLYGVKGLGQWYFEDGGTLGEEQHKLVYYKKNGQEWGTPLDFEVGIESVSTKQINVFPNPVTDVLKINIDRHNFETVYLQIFDSKGAIVYTAVLPEAHNSVDVNNLEEGVYFYRIFNNNKIDKRGKFVKTVD